MQSPRVLPNNFGLGLQPSFGYFINDHIALGIVGEVTYSSSSAPFGSGSSASRSITRSTSYGGGIFARYYKGMTNNLFFFLHGSINGKAGTTHYLSKDHSTVIYSASTHSPALVYLDVNPGMVYFLTPKLGLEFSFGLFETGYTGHTYYYTLDFNSATFRFGLQYYF